ncbi:MAG: Ca-activated chloride channel [Acidobacteriota bacterium]|nr:Ca-activated chloride channel [Acidobacteriota bacterium]
MKPSQRCLRVIYATALCAVIAVSSADAQEKKKEQPAEQPPLSVKLNALVLDSQGHLVNDLHEADFQILEDSVPQKISVFEKQEGPHAFGLVIDSSGSLRNDIDKVIEFGKMIVAGTGAESEGFVVRFVSSDNIKVMQDVTASKTALAGALEDIFIEGGQTAINDAVYLSAERLAKYKREHNSPRRYSLILVTDGEDRASFYKTAQVFAKLHESGLRVFIVGFIQSEYRTTTPEKAKQYMNRLAFESGGSAYFVKKGSELPQVARQILTDMSANYTIGYVSTNSKRDGSTRKIQLVVGNGANGETRKVLAKDSYVAPKK